MLTSVAPNFVFQTKYYYQSLFESHSRLFNLPHARQKHKVEAPHDMEHNSAPACVEPKLLPFHSTTLLSDVIKFKCQSAELETDPTECAQSFVPFYLSVIPSPHLSPLQARCYKPLFTFQRNGHSPTARAFETQHELFIVVMCNVLQKTCTSDLLGLLTCIYKHSLSAALRIHQCIVKKNNNGFIIMDLSLTESKKSQAHVSWNVLFMAENEIVSMTILLLCPGFWKCGVSVKCICEV